MLLHAMAKSQEMSSISIAGSLRDSSTILPSMQGNQGRPNRACQGRQPYECSPLARVRRLNLESALARTQSLLYNLRDLFNNFEAFPLLIPYFCSSSSRVKPSGSVPFSRLGGCSLSHQLPSPHQGLGLLAHTSISFDSITLCYHLFIWTLAEPN